jgi:hypothetical protein
VEHGLHMGDALGSIPSTAETKKTKLSLHTVSKVEKLSQELCLPSVVPSYSGGGDQEDQVSRTAQAKSSRHPISISKILDIMVCLSSQLHRRHK